VPWTFIWKQLGDDGDRHEERGDDREEVDVAVGRFPHSRLDLFAQQAGAILEQFEILADGVEFLQRAAERGTVLPAAPAEKRIGAVGSGEAAALRRDLIIVPYPIPAPRR
jgi:hypothetical protein